MAYSRAIALLSDVDKRTYYQTAYYEIPPLMFQKINEKIPGKSGNVRTLLLYLIFQEQNGSFRPSEETILKACHMVHSKYVAARTTLNDMGLITYIPGVSITINYKKIME